MTIFTRHINRALRAIKGGKHELTVFHRLAVGERGYFPNPVSAPSVHFMKTIYVPDQPFVGLSIRGIRWFPGELTSVSYEVQFDRYICDNEEDVSIPNKLAELRRDQSSESEMKIWLAEQIDYKKENLVGLLGWPIEERENYRLSDLTDKLRTSERSLREIFEAEFIDK